MDEDNRSASVQEVMFCVCVCVCHCVCGEALHDDTERQMPTTVCTTPDFMFREKPT